MGAVLIHQYWWSCPEPFRPQGCLGSNMKEPSSFSLPKLDLYLLEKNHSWTPPQLWVTSCYIHQASSLNFASIGSNHSFSHGFSVLDSSILFRSMDTPMFDAWPSKSALPKVKKDGRFFDRFGTNNTGFCFSENGGYPPNNPPKSYFNTA